MPVLLRLRAASVSTIESSSEAENQQDVLAQGSLVLSTLDSSSKFGQSAEEKTILLTVETFHYRILSHLTVYHSPALNSFIFPPSPPQRHSVALTLSFPSTPEDEVDQATLHALLSQFLTLVEHNPPGLTNKVVLIDDNTGSVVGELDLDEKTMREAMAGVEGGNGPLVIDVADNGLDGQKAIQVAQVPENEMDDWLLRGAANASKGLRMGANFISTKLGNASQSYIASATPRAEPVRVGDRTKASIQAVNSGTGAVRTTVSRGTGFISRHIQKGVEFAVEKGHQGAIQGAQVVRVRLEERQNSAGSHRQTDGLIPPLQENDEQQQPDLITWDDLEQEMPPPPLNHNSAGGGRVPPPKPAKPAFLSTSPASTTSSSPTRPSPPDIPPKPAQRPLMSRLLLAGDVLLTSLDLSTKTVLASATTNSTAAITHKYGAEAGDATRLAGGSLANATLAVIDARGVGRRALVKGAGKGFVKAKMRDERGKTYGQTAIDEQASTGVAVEALNTRDKKKPPSEYTVPSASTSSSSLSFREKGSPPPPPPSPRSSYRSSSCSNTSPLPPPPQRRLLPPQATPPVSQPSRSNHPSPRSSSSSRSSSVASLPIPYPTHSSTSNIFNSNPGLLLKPKPRGSTGWVRPSAPTAEMFASVSNVSKNDFADEGGGTPGIKRMSSPESMTKAEAVVLAVSDPIERRLPPRGEARID